MIVRDFAEDDRELLRSVYLATRIENFGWLDSTSITKSDFDKDTEGERIWVGEKSGDIVGFISVWEPENFIHHLFILPKFSRQGYGSKLLEACMAEIDRPAQLKCVIQNTDAIRFYQYKGWNKVSEGVSSDGEYYLMQAD